MMVGISDVAAVPKPVRSPALSGGALKRFLPVILLSSLVKLVLIWTGTCERGLLADDAYYYFTIARNIAHGLGSTFDGLAPTNGFHPLWQLLVVPCFSLPRLWLPVHVALSITVLFDFLSAILIVDIVRRTTGSDRATLVACALWGFSPWMLLGLRGLESSLSVLTVLFSMRLALAAADAGFPARSSIACGVALALAGMARTDNLPCLAIATASVALCSARGSSSWLKGGRWWLFQGAVAGILVAPWFVWNWREFGMLVQVSGLVKLHTHGLFGALPPWEHSLAGNARVIAHRLMAPFLVPMRFLLAEEFAGSVLTPLMAVIVAGLFLVPVSFAIRDLARDRSTRPVLAFAGAWLLTHLLLFSFLWSSYASWYALVPMSLLFVLTALASASRAARMRWMVRISISTLAAVSVLIYAKPLLRHTRDTVPPDQKFAARLAVVMEEKPTPVLGAFNAGGLGYVARSNYDLTVVNLDGLVNNRVYDALRAHRYVEYVEETVDIMFEDPARASALVTAEEARRLGEIYQQRNDGLWHRVPPRSSVSQ